MACGKDGDHAAHGWCTACYFRWYRAGRPKSGPPMLKRVTPSREEYAYRLDEYAHLISGGETQERAAERIGISIVTARKYAKALERAVA